MANVKGRTVRHAKPKRYKWPLVESFVDFCTSHNRLIVPAKAVCGKLEIRVALPLGVVNLGGGGEVISPHFTAWRSDENHIALLTSMATPKPTRNISVVRRLAMAPALFHK